MQRVRTDLSRKGWNSRWRTARAEEGGGRGTAVLRTGNSVCLRREIPALSQINVRTEDLRSGFSGGVTRSRMP